MKTKKQIKRVILICLILMLCIACFKTSKAYSLKEFGGDALMGVVGLLTIGIQQLAVAMFAAIKLLISAITGLASDGSASAIGDVVFNRCGLTSANFFNEVWVGPKLEEGTLLIVTHIRTYYNVLRNLSIAMLLGILLYIGIRMAISTVASEEAKYKKMLKDWVVSLVLVFVLHYVMIITFFINNVLVESLAQVYDSSAAGDWSELWKQAIIPGQGIPYLIVYGAFITGTLAFVLMYVKRTIVLAFLIVIAPLITITYSIDKIGDGKSQALNNWMKEFIFTVIIQPFHCIIYLVFYQSIMETLNDGNLDLGKMIFAAASAFFMLKAEGIVKKIFGIQPSSIGDALGTGAMALTMATSLFKGKGRKLDESKGTMPKMKGNKHGDGQGTVTTQTPRTQQVADNNGQGSGNGTAAGTPPTGGNQSTGGTPPAGGSQPISVGEPSIDNEPVRQSGKISQAIDKFNSSKLGRHIARKGGWGALAGRKISGAATLTGFIAGGTVGDFKTAMSTATAAGSVVKTKVDDFAYSRAEKRLIDNQEVFAGAYEDFAAAYRERYGDVDDKEISTAARDIFEGGGQNLTEEYERDFFDQMDQLSTSAEVYGYGNGFDYVKDSIRKTQMGVIEPKSDYIQKSYKVTPSRPRRNNNTNNNNTNS